jgi:multiple sugar transport system permease protein
MLPSIAGTGRARSRSYRRLSKSFTRFLVYVVVLGGAVLMIYPLLWLVSASFKPEDLIFSTTGLLSPQWMPGNYSDGWNALDYPFAQFFFNSLIICLGAVVGNLLSCSLAAYAFARLRFKYKPFWFALMLGGILLPAHVLIVPQYILFKELGWIGTLLPLVAPKFFATDAFFIFLMIQFIRGIPLELDDAAKIDGCSHFSFYWRVILPLALPALVTTAIFTFIWTWNDFFSQLIYLTSDESINTVPVALSHFVDSTGGSSYGQLFAMSVLSLLPIFGFFLIFQRLLIQGASTTGLKG